MASTNKTTHYELSQYVGTDKPTYLTDYNNDMSAIDTGIYNAQTKADSAYTLAGTAEGKADNAQLTANSALTNAGTANTNIGTMANLETTEKSSLVGAINEVEGNIEKFNFTSFISYNTSDVTLSAGTLQSCSLTVATNSDGSIGKVYGNFEVNTSSLPDGTIVKVTIPASNLRPSSNIIINSAGINFYDDSKQVYNKDITIKSNGDVEIEIYSYSGTTFERVILFPCLYFMKDFGDTPTPNN